MAVKLDGPNSQVVVDEQGSAPTGPAASKLSLWVKTDDTVHYVTSAGIDHAVPVVATGKTLTVSNSLTLAGTDSTTMTFPSTSATIARTDAAQTTIPTACAYRWTDWDPSDVAATYTSPTSTTASSVTADGYITMANSSGTVTLTCVTAGNYKVTISVQNESGASATAIILKVTLGGTATRHITNTTVDPIAVFTSGGVPISGNVSFMMTMTASQTLTVLPQISVTSSGATTSFTTSCNLTAEYCGT